MHAVRLVVFCFFVSFVCLIPFIQRNLIAPWQLNIVQMLMSTVSIVGPFVLFQKLGRPTPVQRLSFLVAVTLVLFFLLVSKQVSSLKIHDDHSNSSSMIASFSSSSEAMAPAPATATRRRQKPTTVEDLIRSSPRLAFLSTYEPSLLQSSGDSRRVAFILQYDQDDGQKHELTAVLAQVRSLRRLEPTVDLVLMAARGALAARLSAALSSMAADTAAVTHVVAYDPVPKAAYKPIVYLKRVDRIRLWSEPVHRLGYDRLVFVDSQTLVLQPVSRWLAQYPGWPPAFSADASEANGAKPGSGLLVLTADPRVEHAMLQSLQRAEYRPTYSTSVYAFFDWFFAGRFSLLPWTACMAVRSVFQPPLRQFDAETTACLHWQSGARPWDKQQRNDIDQLFTPLWQAHVKDIIKLVQ